MAKSLCVCLCCNKKKKEMKEFYCLLTIILRIKIPTIVRIFIKYAYFFITSSTLGIVSGKKGKKYNFLGGGTKS